MQGVLARSSRTRFFANEPTVSAPYPRRSSHDETERGEGDQKKSFWTKIGVAYENRDGSWNLRFDYHPARPDITVQLRPFSPREDKDEASAV